MTTYSIVEIGTRKILIEGQTQIEADTWIQEREKSGQDRSLYSIEAE